MRILLLFSLLMAFSLPIWAQNLTADEQRQLLEDVKALKAKVSSLEAEKKSAGASTGLKSTDYHSGTTATNSAAPGTPTTPALTPEQMKDMMDSLHQVKAKQEENNKVLKELDEEED